MLYENLTPKWAWLRSRDHFPRFWDPLYIFGMTKDGNFIFGASQRTTNWPLQWAWSGSRDLKLNVSVCVEVYVRMSPGQWRRGDVRRLSRRLHRTTLWALCWRLRRRPDKTWRHLYNPRSFVIPHTWLKDHRQRIPRFLIRRYLEKSIQKKLFLPFTIITNKDYFPRKIRL